MYKQTIGITIAIVVGLAVFGLIQNIIPNTIEPLGGGGSTTVYQTLGGSASDLIMLPDSFVESSATTTDADGGLWTQQIETNGVNRISISGQAIGGTVTSTFSFRTQISQDGTTFFNVTGNSTSTDGVATTTGTILPQTFSFDPGTATTSFSYILELPSSKYVRLLLLGENIATDPDDDVQAFVQVGLEAGY